MAHIKLKDVINRVQTKVDKDNTSLIYYVGGEHIESENVCITKRGLIEGSTIGPMFYYGFKAGDFLLVSRNPHLKKAGVVGFDGICSEKTFVLATANSEVLLPEYLPFILQNDTFWEYAYQHRHGSTNTFINWSTLANYEFELPNIEIQRKLAEILWAINDTMESYKRLILATDELVKSQFIEMFGDPLKNPRHLPQFRLEKFIHFLTSGSRGWAKYYSEDGEWFITITNVKNCKVSIDNIQCICPPHNAEAERTRVKEGDLLISVTADLGRTGVITKEIADHGAYINQHLTCIRLEQSALDPTYVAYFMETEAGKKQFFEKNLSSVKAGLNFDSIRSLRLLVPPLEQQKEFVNFLQQSDKSKFAVLNCLKRNLLLILQKTEDVHSLINQSAKKYFCKSCHRENHNG